MIVISDITIRKVKTRRKRTKVIKCKTCKSKLLISCNDLQECTGNMIGYEITCPICKNKKWINMFTGSWLSGKWFQE